MKVRLDEIAEWLGGQVEGDKSIYITGLDKIEQASPGDLSFVANPKYEKYAKTSQASALLVDQEFPSIENKTFIRCNNPYFAFLKLVKRFLVVDTPVQKGIHKTAVIGDNTKIGKNVSIGAYAVIGDACRIGDNTAIHPGAVLYSQVQMGNDCIIYANVSIRERTRIGNRVIIHMGAVIGSDGFGYAFEDNRYHKIPQTGIVVIEDDVEIGANTAIDRASLGETVIGKGVKLDNLIQIAHSVQIGEHSAIASQTGISGSTQIGKYTKIGGQAGFVGHIKIGDYAMVGAQAGITKDVPENTFVSGYPARSHMTAKREEASLAKLPDLLKRFRALEKQVNELKKELAEKK